MSRLVSGLLTVALVLNFGMSHPATTTVSEHDVRKWLAVWQRREGLQNRPVFIHFLHAGFEGDSVACVSWWQDHDVINISFLKPSEWGTSSGWSGAEIPLRAEVAVVHELVHVVTSSLYDDGSGRGWTLLAKSAASDARMEVITENLAWLLIRRRAPAGGSVPRYITQQIDSGPWRPAPDVRERVILQIVRAVKAANEDDLLLTPICPLACFQSVISECQQKRRLPG